VDLADRKHGSDKPLLLQFGQYTLACLFGILLQLAFTKILAARVHYLLANFTAILAAGIFNYLVNDAWTFGLGKLFSIPTRENRPLRIWLCIVAGIAVFTYFSGWTASTSPRTATNTLYQYHPVTAESGALLPLQSTMEHMRNTKPPMLFWQGIASTHWGNAGRSGICDTRASCTPC